GPSRRFAGRPAQCDSETHSEGDDDQDGRRDEERARRGLPLPCLRRSDLGRLDLPLCSSGAFCLSSAHHAKLADGFLLRVREIYGGEREKGEGEREAGEGERGDGHVPELVYPLRGAAARGGDQARLALAD